jgi:hypothetical protein
VPSPLFVAPFVIAAVIVAIVLNFFAGKVEDELPGGFNSPKGTTQDPAIAKGVRWTGAALCALLAAMLVPVALASSGRALQVTLLIAASLSTGAWFLVRRRHVRRLAATAALAALSGAFAL